MLRWFGHVERMSERRLRKGIYVADVSGNALERPDLIGKILQKGQVRSTRNRRACMNVDEVKGLCKNVAGGVL